MSRYYNITNHHMILLQIYLDSSKSYKLYIITVTQLYRTTWTRSTVICRCVLTYIRFNTWCSRFVKGFHLIAVVSCSLRKLDTLNYEEDTFYINMCLTTQEALGEMLLFLQNCVVKHVHKLCSDFIFNFLGTRSRRY
jgi:hypothetical protein